MTLNVMGERHSIRLKGFDYGTAGGYYITLCTEDRLPIFGEIIDGNMARSSIGEIVHQEWLRTSIIRPEITLDEFMVMPDHFHAILFIGTIAMGNVGAHGCAPNPMTGSIQDNGDQIQFNPFHRQKKSLSSLVAQFKATTTRLINELRNTRGIRVWQRGYYDRIIRNEVELDHERKYIRDNPKQ